MPDVTLILSQIESGDPSAAELLLPLVYEELRKLAAARLAHDKSGQILQATALVHEAYLRLVGNQQFENRRHLLAAAAEAMRRIMVDEARRRGRQKRGGRLLRVELFDQAELLAEDPDLILSLEKLPPRSGGLSELVGKPGCETRQVTASLTKTNLHLHPPMPIEPAQPVVAGMLDSAHSQAGHGKHASLAEAKGED